MIDPVTYKKIIVSIWQLVKSEGAGGAKMCWIIHPPGYCRMWNKYSKITFGLESFSRHLFKVSLFKIRHSFLEWTVNAIKVHLPYFWKGCIRKVPCKWLPSRKLINMMDNDSCIPVWKCIAIHCKFIKCFFFQDLYWFRSSGLKIVWAEPY